ncbi:MAG: hypothetical protein SGPRY_004835 [Prymnesium sp.]
MSHKICHPQCAMGPGDPVLDQIRNCFDPYREPSQASELTIKCCIDSGVYTALPLTLSHLEMSGNPNHTTEKIENRVNAMTWSSVTVGAIIVAQISCPIASHSRSNDTARVICSANCMMAHDVDNYKFIGIARNISMNHHTYTHTHTHTQTHTHNHNTNGDDDDDDGDDDDDDDDDDEVLKRRDAVLDKLQRRLLKK